MNNASSVKSNKIGTPKTPGGISKSLLTPCRRLGLSRNWRKSGPSPFVSPLSRTEVKQETTETRKRKECVLNEPTTTTGDEGTEKNIDRTPSRNVDLPRRKKSKTLLTALTKSEKSVTKSTNYIQVKLPDDLKEVTEADTGNYTENIAVSEVSSPVHSKSIKSKRNFSPIKLISQEKYANENLSDNSESKETKSVEIIENRENNPNNLTKECIVVIQKKLFKGDIIKKCGTNIPTNNENKSVSQALFDSDSDEKPLSNLNNKKIKDVTKQVNFIAGDDDFADRTNKSNIKLARNKPSNAKYNSKFKSKTDNDLKMAIITETSKPSSQSSIDDDDDFENKRTILIKKTYKISKAKSTGSITQKDIDELKARIEAKKKLILVKSITEDTKELRDLVKKWQKGCQDALMELMDLMRNKFPDKQNMDYSEILQTLKIPASLVGYDSDNDCFNTPDDASIILAKLNDL